MPTIAAAQDIGLIERAGGQKNDRDALGTFPLLDEGGQFEAADGGHLHIHQDDGEVLFEDALEHFPLVAEVTERALPNHSTDLIPLAEDLRRRGARIALDDVGTDPRSLALLPFLRPYAGRIAAAFFALICSSTASLVLPPAVGRMIDHGFNAAMAAQIGKYFFVIVALATTVITIVVATMAGYALARLRIRGTGPILAFILLAGFFPVLAMIGPLFLVLRYLGWLNSIWPRT